MTNREKYRLLILFAFCCFAWMACTQERQPCFTPKRASLRIHCVHKQTDTATVFVDTALPTALLIAFTDSGASGTIYTAQQSYFTLSLSSVTDSCKWAIGTDTTGAALDTLTFYYQRRQQFLSNACGYTYFYNLESVRATTGVLIDSVRITNTNVNNDANATHLQIFVHPGF